MSKIDLTPLEPEQAIKFFEQKGYQIGFDWRDIWKEEHAIAFSVAKATSIDILQDIRNELEVALKEGVTFETFKKNLRPTLEKKGWWGEKIMLDPKTGEQKKVQLGSVRRLNIIFDTNMRMSYAAGHWQDIEDNAESSPYLKYVTVMDGKQREQHAQWNGLVLRYDDSFWKTHYPPNGWRCRCSVLQFSDYELQKRGLKVSKSPQIKTRQWENKRTGETLEVPEGIAPGFDYNIGKARLKTFTPPPSSNLPETFQNRGKELPALPKPSKLPKNVLLQEGLTEKEYAKAFLKEFGADIGKSVVYEDVTGEPLVIDEGLFTVKKTGAIKVNKNNRGVYMRLLAEAIKDPDEIWLRWEKERTTEKIVLKRRYIKIFEDTEGSHTLSVFEKGKDSWTGSTTFPVKTGKTQKAKEDYINNFRDGFLAYKKKSAGRRLPD